MNKKISEFLDDDAAITINADASVKDAISVMASEKHNYVLVTDNGSVLGIFTDRDLLNRVTAEKRLPADVKIRDVMTPEPDSLHHDDYIGYAIERMARYGVRNIPVETDTSEKAVLTVWNVMTHLSEILADVEETEHDKDIIEAVTDTGGG